MIDIKPYKTKEYNSRQSRHDHVGKLPARQIFAAPSGVGKTVTLTNLILNVYRDCFEKIFIFSPTIHLDNNWDTVKDYISNKLKINHTEDDPVYFDTFNEEQMKNIIDTQEKIVKYMKDKDFPKIYNIAIIIDDFSDNKDVARKNKELVRLFVKGRHYFISTFITCQSYTLLNPVVRKNATQLYVYRLRNQKDLDSIIDELSALYDKQTLLQLYHTATDEKHSFMFINMMESDKEKCFIKI